MAKELAFALLTPYSLMKSRTGGIMGRIMVRTGLELVGTRMIAPSRELVEAYATMLEEQGDIAGTGIDEGKLLSRYVREELMPNEATGKRKRVMLLVLEGEDAVAKINRALGSFARDIFSAESVRDTYGDFVTNEAGDVVFIEPAAMTAGTVEHTRDALRLWIDSSEADGGVIHDVVDIEEGPDCQKTLVILKPDNFTFASVRPGTIIDIFSGSGLRIVAAKINRMSVAEALEFYGPVRDVLRRKKKEPAGRDAREAVEKVLDMPLSDEVEAQLGEIIGPLYGDKQFNELVQFMTGVWEPDCPESEHTAPGKVRTLALVYYGRDAISKIRAILGPTDPSKAEPGSVRREYGTDVMVNAAHASDAPENAEREMGIIKVDRDGLKALLEQHYGA
jgi:nucleoside diphosphate kinase